MCNTIWYVMASLFGFDEGRCLLEELKRQKGWLEYEILNLEKDILNAENKLSTMKNELVNKSIRLRDIEEEINISSQSPAKRKKHTIFHFQY